MVCSLAIIIVRLEILELSGSAEDLPERQLFAMAMTWLAWWFMINIVA
jgi:hypothetical protein